MAGPEEPLPVSRTNIPTVLLGWQSNKVNNFWWRSSSSSTARWRAEDEGEIREGEELKGSFKMGSWVRSRSGHPTLSAGLESSNQSDGDVLE